MAKKVAKTSTARVLKAAASSAARAVAEAGPMHNHKRNVTLSLNRVLLENLQRYCTEKGHTMSYVIDELLEAFLNEVGDRKR